MKLLTSVVTFALFTSSFALADSSTPPTIADIVANRVTRLTKLLTLTTAQATSATALFTTEETALATIRTNLATAQTALTTAVEANSTTGIATAANQIGTLTASEELAEATAEAGFYVLLTTDQQTKYKELLSAGLDQPGDGGGAGHGGPHR